ncbi:hypothetical protein P171DRAFT_437881 [Karstenula rhodostoma CBS 690.94]|uniref:Uncharacterized protein n=1 Tax=Karstenula rhodostoma CBS 690.94 TaxID=1392251 RepID=A0A9P4P4Q9_9PLEO|nr:hypothetical protein P171DRAFT_437881 [Karstenula rhodostoma CBS 690.94]
MVGGGLVSHAPVLVETGRKTHAGGKHTLRRFLPSYTPSVINSAREKNTIKMPVPSTASKLFKVRSRGVCITYCRKSCLTTRRDAHSSCIELADTLPVPQD